MKPYCNTDALKSLLRILIQSQKPKYSKAWYISENELESNAFSKSTRTKKPDLFSFSMFKATLNRKEI